MADEKYPQQDEEFQFSEAEADDVYGSTAAENKPIKFTSQLNRRNLLILIGIVVIAFAVYKLFEVFYAEPITTPKTAQQSPAVPVIQHTAQPVPRPVPAVTLPAPAPSQALQPTSPYVAAAEQKFNQQEEAIVDNQRKMNALSEEVGNLQQRLNNLQEGVQTLNQKLNNITSLLEVQSAQMKSLKAAAKPKTTIIKRIARPALYIKALIPNRAWLVDPNGNIFTVSIGESIPYYGRVTQISVGDGTVVTNSGAIIYFKDQ